MVDDPLPPRAELASKQRLRATIRSLNLRQQQDGVRFVGDGTGTAIRWKLREPRTRGAVDHAPCLDRKYRQTEL